MLTQDLIPTNWKSVDREIRADYPNTKNRMVAKTDLMTDQQGELAAYIVQQVKACDDMRIVLSEFVRLWDAGLRPQIVKGGWREEHDFAETIQSARVILNNIQIK